MPALTMLGGWLKTTVSGVSRPKVQPAARLVTVNPAGKRALPRTAGVRGVMPTGFAAANISSKTAGHSGRLADRDGFRYCRISFHFQFARDDAVVRRAHGDHWWAVLASYRLGRQDSLFAPFNVRIASSRT